jgi:phosphoribosylformylglycinamidine cyclo-ligase
MHDGSLTYRTAGVDRVVVAAGLDAVSDRIRQTFSTRVLGDLGHFAGLFRLGEFRDPVLVSSIDGVGTKIVLARQAGKLDVAGWDAIVHGINDVAVLGAVPLFALDYVAATRVDPADLAALVSGMTAACREAGVALLGGETAQMPGVYTADGLDVVACVIGVAEREAVCDGTAIRSSDAVIGLASNGLHTNGYTLVRAVMARCRWTPETMLPELDSPLGDILMRPHRSYQRVLRAAAGAGWLRGAAHITGGGLPGNLVRILPPACRARIDTASWPVPPIFEVVARGGRIARDEMLMTFNMGIGLAAVVPPAQARRALDCCRAVGVDGWIIGEIIQGERGVELV